MSLDTGASGAAPAPAAEPVPSPPITSPAAFEPTAFERALGWRPTRRSLVVATLLGLALVVLVVFSPRRVGYLDPRAVDPQGSRAVANVLGGQGVRVVPTQGFDEVLREARGATVLVTVPMLPPPSVVEGLVARAPAWVVLVAGVPGDPLMDRLAAGVRESDPAGEDPVSPGCTDPTVQRAGAAALPGLRYDARAWAGAGEACYDQPGSAGVVVIDPRPGRPGVILLGSDFPLTNEGFDTEGNAALALGVLGGEDTLVWWRPDAGDPALAGAEPVGVVDLLPAWVLPVLGQIFVAVVLVAVWRGRRLGRLVVEPLPVVVRAEETTAGHARLLHAAHARGEAARHLRAASRQRIGARLGVPPASSPERLVAAVAARTGRRPGEVSALLYGPEPEDDEALVRLDHDLTALRAQVGTTEVAGA